MYKTDTDKLASVMEQKGITIEKMAQILSVDRSTLYRRLSSNKLRISDMQLMAEALGLSRNEACSIFLSK